LSQDHPNASGEKPVLKLMFSAMICRRALAAIRISDFERRQMAGLDAKRAAQAQIIQHPVYLTAFTDAANTTRRTRFNEDGSP